MLLPVGVTPNRRPPVSSGAIRSPANLPYVAGATAEGFPEEWDLEKLWRALRQLYPVGITIGQLVEETGGERSHLTKEIITEAVQADAHAA